MVHMLLVSEAMPCTYSNARFIDDQVEFVKIDGQWKIKRRELGTYAYVPRETLMDK
jgi:hypothetical protein